MEISKAQYEAYEAVRLSGVTNMFAVDTVAELSGLTREEVLEVQKQYTELKEKFSTPQPTDVGNVICPTCKKEFDPATEEGAFVLDIGECGSCDHVRGDVMADMESAYEEGDVE